MSALIQANNLHRYYGDTHAVNDVSIDVHKGDILALLGPNGAGKSSCLQMICGVLAPSAGEILINGTDLIEQPRQAKQHIGYLPDKPPLYPELNVKEYLHYAAQLRRVNKKKIRSFCDEAIERCGLIDYQNRLIGNLSKGYQQRVGIAQAIVHHPKVIILDEPTVGLDPIQMVEIRKLILTLGEQHGVILSTHILPEVQAVCNRVQMIHQGKSVINKKMQELKKTSQVSLHLQTPPPIDELKNIPNVENIEKTANHHYLLNGKNLHTSLAKVSQYCVEKKWGLLEISIKENTLEQIFLNLTSGEDTHAQEHIA